MADAQQTAQTPPPAPRPPPRGIEPVAPARFDDVLRSARLRLGALAVLELLLAGAAGVAAGLVVAAVVVGVAPYSTALRVLLVALLPAGFLAAAAAVLARRVWPLKHDLVVGAALEASLRRRGAELGDMVRGAVELRDAAQDGARGRSRALCEAHVAATTARVVDGGGLRSLPGVALERAVPTLACAGVVGFVLLAWIIAFSASWQSRFDKLFSDAGRERALEERAASLLPLVTDLKLTLRFPAYMQENDEVIPGSSGDVTAPRGTEVVVEGRADRALEKASVLVGDEELQAKVNGADLVARFVVNESTTYRFRIDGARGGAELDPVAHKIAVTPDTAPVVTLEEPGEDRTVKLEDTVPLAFSAKDDVGVTRFRVVVKRQGSALEPYTDDLMEVPGGLREAHGTGKLKIEDTGARPGDKLSVYIEAVDNDAISGPKAGRSATRVLTVFSALEQHRAMIARLDDVESRMVDSLGDELEAPLAELSADVAEQKQAVDKHQQIAVRHQAMQKALDDAVLALSQDEMAVVSMRRALANMKLKVGRAVDHKARALSELAFKTRASVPANKGVRARLAFAQKGLVERLEQDVLYLDDLLQRERIAEARQVAQDLKRAQEDLKALVDQFKKSGDDATRRALLQQIQEMRAQMEKLLERLAELQHEVPDEYLNSEAFPDEKMLSNASDIDKLIEEGKLDDAAKKLEEMLKATQKLVDNLDKDADQYGGDEYKELRDKMQRFSDDLQALQEGQQQNLAQSQALMDRAKRQAEERLKGKLDKALAEVKKKVEAAEKKLDGIDRDSLFLNESEDALFAKARIDDLKRALESKDLEDATGAAEEAEAAAESAQRSVADRARGRFGQKDKATAAARDDLDEAHQDLDEARRALQDLLPNPSSLLDKNERRKLQKGADLEQQLRENAEKLGKLMDEIGKQAPVFGPGHKKHVDSARRSMERAARQMRGQDLRSARSSERAALRELGQLQKDLDQMGQGQGGSGIPMPLPNGGAPGADDGEGNGRRASTEEVKIPDGSEFKVPDAYRKDILDAMREGAPKSWAQEVKRYYERLIK